MMFKAIYMHTKPLKHTKNMQILTIYIKRTRFFQNILQMFQNGKTFQKLPFSYFACTFVWMFPTFLKIQNLLKACLLMLFAIFTFVFFVIFFFLHFLHTKRKLPCILHVYMACLACNSL